MTPGELAKTVSSGKFKPAYYFYGSEDFRMVEAEKFVAHKFLPDESFATNFRRINSRKIKSADLIAELSVYPMLGERQVFSIVDFQSYKPTEIKRILATLNPPDPNRLIIFVTPAARAPKKKSAFVRNMAEVSAVVEFGKLDERESRTNILSKLEKAGLTIDQSALARLTAMLAGNRGALETEVDKLINYKSGDNDGSAEISLSDVQVLSAGHEVFSVFELAELIVDGNLARALKLVDQLLGEGVSPTGLLYHVNQHFLTLYNLKNGKPLEVYRKWLTQRFQTQAAKFSQARIRSAIRLLAETDANLRQGGLSGRLALEELIVRLVSVQGKK